MLDSWLGWARGRLRSTAQGRSQSMSRHFDTSDVVQESMLQLVAATGEADGTPIRTGAYLKRVAMGQISNLSRHFSAQKRCPPRSAMRVPESVVRAEQLDPAREAQHQEELLRMLRAMSQLDKDDEQMIYLRYFDGKTLSEISAETGATMDVVRTRLTNSLKVLKIKLS